jgi:catechol 2,3-dioxygenase
VASDIGRRTGMSQRENSARTATESETSPPRLPATLRLGAVHLTVSDLESSVAFYRGALGLRLHRREKAVAAMGTGGEEDLVVLHEEPGARRAGRHAGLYHYALLYPSRMELARAALRLVATRTPIQGASDHGTHEAIYLRDPDGNGIELAADRPRDVWPDLANPGWDGGPRPLDLDGLLALVAGEEPRREAGSGLVVGHVHLHVGDIERGLSFYRDVLGFERMFSMPTAAFVAAGGYHHHLGFNVWRGEGVSPAPAGRVGLRHWTIVLDDPADLDAVRRRVRAAGVEVEEREDGGFVVRDPWEIAVLFTVAQSSPSASKVGKWYTHPDERIS